MKFQILQLFSRSASFEIQNDTCYFAPETYRVLLNDTEVISQGESNIFSLYDLTPDTEYSLTVLAQEKSKTVTFQTEKETIALNVKDFGATGNGTTQDTAYLQAAIAACPKGGTVFVPAGTYRSTSLFLKSDMTLYLEKGAIILGETDRSQYPILPGESVTGQQMFPLGSWEGDPNKTFASLLTGISLENVNIIGEGVLDANAQNSDWWEDVKVMRTAWRPRVLFLNQCQQVRVQGVTFANSYSWTVHPYYCDHVSIVDVRIKNNPNSPNTDGINPESCHHVEILGAKISVGDDCIAIKSGKIHMATTRHKDSRHITVRNCHMERGHGAVVLGSEIAGGVRDVHITQCFFEHTDRGLRIKTRRGRGEASVVDGIHFENVIMDYVGSAFTANMFYFCDPDGHSDYVQTREPLPVDYRTPTIGTITCKNIICTNVVVSGGYFSGLPEQPIENITFQNISITFAPEDQRTPEFPIMADKVEAVEGLGIFADQVETLLLENVTLQGEKGEPFQIGNVKNFTHTS